MCEGTGQQMALNGTAWVLILRPESWTLLRISSAKRKTFARWETCTPPAVPHLPRVALSSQILVDVRQVQKEINSIGETCQRSFAVVDEKIFQAANQGGDSGKKDPAATQAYKNLHSLQKCFDRLVKAVEDMVGEPPVRRGVSSPRCRRVGQRTRSATSVQTWTPSVSLARWAKRAEPPARRVAQLGAQHGEDQGRSGAGQEGEQGDHRQAAGGRRLGRKGIIGAKTNCVQPAVYSQARTQTAIQQWSQPNPGSVRSVARAT
jgi:hypothetical protein